jgi:hypothetical protein
VIDTPPNTSSSNKPRHAAALVVKPLPKSHPAVTRGCIVPKPSGALLHVTAEPIQAIDFYPANPVNHHPEA